MLCRGWQLIVRAICVSALFLADVQDLLHFGDNVADFVLHFDGEGGFVLGQGVQLFANVVELGGVGEAKFWRMFAALSQTTYPGPRFLMSINI